jgi:hypothetical protein
MKVLEHRKLGKKIEGLKLATKMRTVQDLYLSGGCTREQYEVERKECIDSLASIGEAGNVINKYAYEISDHHKQVLSLIWPLLMMP